jgi:hypothetical protein
MVKCNDLAFSPYHMNSIQIERYFTGTKKFELELLFLINILRSSNV